MDDDAASKLLEYVRVTVGREHGLDEAASRRLSGSTIDELHADARALAQEIGVRDPTLRARHGDGQFAGAGGDMNRIIRSAAGRQ